MSVRGHKRKSEGELVNNHTFGLGVHVNVTKQQLEEKGIHSPSKWKHYATATHYEKKVQFWFRTPERLELWRKNTSMLELEKWTIQIINHGRSTNISDQETTVS